MKSSEQSRITDELLSAYIDNAVTEQERNLVEAAVAADAEVAWRLDTLEQTVQMLRTLPDLVLPRSFTLQESQLLAAGPSAGADPQPQETSWIERVAAGWRGFWQSGSPVYRNLAAASLVLMLVLVGGNTYMVASVNTLSGIVAPADELAYSEAPAAMESGDAVAQNTGAVTVESVAAAEDIAPQVDEASSAEEAATADAPAMRVQEPPASAPVQEMPAEESAAHQPEITASTTQPLARAAALPEVAAAGEAAPEGLGPFAAEGAEGESFAAEPLAMKAPAPSAAAPPAEDAPVAPAPRAGAAPPLPDAADNAESGADAADLSSLEGEEGVSSARIAGIGAPTASADGETLEEAADAETAVVAAALPVAEEPVQATRELTDAETVTAPGEEEAEKALAPQTPALVATDDEETVGLLAGENDMSRELPDASAGGTAVEETVDEDATDQVEAVAALPTAQPLPTTVQPTAPSDQKAQPAPGFKPGALDPLRLLAVGLLTSTIVFGGLWWRSRDSA